MRAPRPPLSRLLLLLLLASTPGLARAAAPGVSFDETGVRISASRPASRVALLGIGRLTGGYLPAQVHFAELLVADAFGEARYESDYGTPTWSVWAAVDLSTGEVTVAAPEQGELRLRQVPTRALRSELDGLDDSRRFLEVLLVRPDSAPGTADGAAWHRAVGDGGDDDGDGATDGRLRVVPSLLEPIGDAPVAPERFAAGDVIVAIDTDTLEVWAASAPGR